MKKVIFLTLVIFGSWNANAFDINSYCREVSDAVGGSYQIEEACRKLEYKAQANIGSMNIPSRIENYCTEIGQAVGGSYQIMEVCIQQEMQAKSRL